MACGPSVGSSTDGGGGGGDAGDSGGASTGYVLTSSDSSAPGSSGDSTTLSTGPDDGGSGTSSESSTSGDPPSPECNPGDSCGELLLCECTCDVEGCCECTDVECTTDEHCAEGICGELTTVAWHHTLACVPSHCTDRLTVEWVDENPTGLSDVACLRELHINDGKSDPDLSPLASLVYLYDLLEINGTDLSDLSGLENLAEVRTISIVDNASLSSVAALAGLQSIVEGGEIRNNPALPSDEVLAILARIPGGDAVTVCGNLGEAPC